MADAAMVTYSIGGGEFRLEHDRAAALYRPFVIWLGLFLIIGDELAVAEAFCGMHWLGRLLDDRITPLRIIGEGFAQTLFELCPACLGNLAKQLAPWILGGAHGPYRRRNAA